MFTPLSSRLRLVSSFSEALFAIAIVAIQFAPAAEPEGLTIHWEKNFLTIGGPTLSNREITIHYLEAYCRPGSTDREWSETVIGHRTELINADSNKQNITLRDYLKDGVIVDHTIRASLDEIDFQLIARNPTTVASLAHWAQPCIRVDRFTGTDPKDARQLFPPYIRKCFLFIDDQFTRLPTIPWADKARYVPGQVYSARGINRDDVNPRPLSSIIPSHGLCGCFSEDEKQIMAVAWQPYQEIFQGVITCIHNDFRIGGLEPNESKSIRGKIYIVPADVPALVARYRRDFGRAD